MGELLRRWLLFAGALVLTLVPALLGLSVAPVLAEFPRFFNAAWIWQIMATAPAGYARVDFDGQVWFADSGWLLSLACWAALGLVYAVAFRSLRLCYYGLLVFPLVFASGLLAQLLLLAAGVTPYVGV